MNGQSDLGSVRIYKKNRRYRYSTTKAKDEADLYYKFSFKNASCGIRKLVLERQALQKKKIGRLTEYDQMSQSEILEVSKDYIKGLFWIFNFHMNMNDQSFNTTYKCTWSYKYPMAPLLYNITQQLKLLHRDKNGFNELFNDVADNYFVKTDDYYSSIEYYMYVNPPELISPYIIGNELYNEYRKKCVENPDCILDDRLFLKEAIVDMWEGSKSIVLSRDGFLRRGVIPCISHICINGWRQMMSECDIDVNAYSLPDRFDGRTQHSRHSRHS